MTCLRSSVGISVSYNYWYHSKYGIPSYARNNWYWSISISSQQRVIGLICLREFYGELRRFSIWIFGSICDLITQLFEQESSFFCPEDVGKLTNLIKSFVSLLYLVYAILGDSLGVKNADLVDWHIRWISLEGTISDIRTSQARLGSCIDSKSLGVCSMEIVWQSQNSIFGVLVGSDWWSRLIQKLV